MNQKFNLKGNNFIKNMLRYSYLIIVSLLLNAAVNGIIVSANRIISVNIDHMLAGEAVDISTVIIKFIYLTLSGFVLSFAGSRLSLKYAVRVINSYRKQISSKLYRIDYSYYDNAGTATIINKVNSDRAFCNNYNKYYGGTYICQLCAKDKCSAFCCSCCELSTCNMAVKYSCEENARCVKDISFKG